MPLKELTWDWLPSQMGEVKRLGLIRWVMFMDKILIKWSVKEVNRELNNIIDNNFAPKLFYGAFTR